MTKVRILSAIFSFISLGANAGDFQFGLGAGVPYGGIIGTQFSNAYDHGRFRLSLGVVGLVGGYDHFFSQKCSAGGTVGFIWQLGSKINASAGINCSLKNDHTGFNYGLDISTYQQDDDNAADSSFNVDSDNADGSTSLIPTINIGYRF